MVLTQTTLTFGLAMTSAIISLVIGAYSGKRFSSAIAISFILIFAILPLAFYFIYLQLVASVSVWDWLVNLGSFTGLWNPGMAIWLASSLGGIFGLIAGNYWGQDDVSCFRCLLGPFILVFLLSIVMIFLP